MLKKKKEGKKKKEKTPSDLYSIVTEWGNRISNLIISEKFPSRGTATFSDIYAEIMMPVKYKEFCGTEILIIQQFCSLENGDLRL